MNVIIHVFADECDYSQSLIELSTLVLDRLVNTAARYEVLGLPVYR